MAEFGAQVVVYGPDGTQYGSPAIADRAGVTNYTMEQPVVPDMAPGSEKGTNMAEDTTTKGKTGEELEQSILQKQAEQTDKTALSSEQTITPTPLTESVT